MFLIDEKFSVHEQAGLGRKKKYEYTLVNIWNSKPKVHIGSTSVGITEISFISARSRLSRPRSLCDITNQSRRGLGEIFSPLQISPRSRLNCSTGRIYVFFYSEPPMSLKKKKNPGSCMYHKAEKSPSHLNHLDSCSRFIFISLCFWVW